MAGNTENMLERRVASLSAAIQARRQLYADALRPKGQRPAFTQQLSRPEALAWWQQHRYDDLGKQVLANMQPDGVMELDLALSKANEPTTEEVDNGIY